MNGVRVISGTSTDMVMGSNCPGCDAGGTRGRYCPACLRMLGEFIPRELAAMRETFAEADRLRAERRATAQICEWCGPQCLGGAAHNARQEDGCRYGDLPGETRFAGIETLPSREECGLVPIEQIEALDRAAERLALFALGTVVLVGGALMVLGFVVFAQAIAAWWAR